MRLGALGLMAVVSTGVSGKPSPVTPGGEAGWERSLAASFSTQGGNTNLSSYALAFTVDYTGDLRVAGVDFNDSEFHAFVRHKRGKLDRSLYEDDGSASLLFDIMAHGKFSPFFLSYWAYDSTTGLDERIQLGAGGKYTVAGGFSLSLAYLFEVEGYKGESRTRQYRLSFRPKYKRTFSSGVSLNTLVFIQPLVLDPGRFLIDSHVSVTVPTPVKILADDKKLEVTLRWREQFNSRPPGSVQKRDSDLDLGLMISF
ncbi:MAG: DUF481 domain-containing protein [Fidelibacterota bacterium]